MITLFNLASNDQATLYLCTIFGSMGAGLSCSNTNTLFSTMSHTVANMALVLGSLMVVHTTVMGLIKTANEGEFLGKEWSSLWVPLRTVMGIASLFPMTSGYTVLQVVMMWFIVQGVGAADTLWDVTINAVKVAGSPYASASLPTEMDIANNMQTLMKAYVCQASAQENRSALQYPKENYFYYCADPSNQKQPFCTSSAGTFSSSASGTTATWTFGPKGACGSLTFGNAGAISSEPKDEVKKAAYVAQDAALTVISARMNTIAKKFVDLDREYLEFYEKINPNNCFVAAPPSWIKDFCSAQSIGANNCCLYNDSAADSKPCPTKSTACIAKSDGLFPRDYNSGPGGTNDYTNASKDAIQGQQTNLYWTSGMQQFLEELPAVTDGSGCKLGNGANFNADFVSYYACVVNGAVSKVLQRKASESKIPTTGPLGEAVKQGWLLAGGYYYYMAEMNDDNLQDAIPPFAVTGSDPAATQDNAMRNYRNNYTAAGYLLAVTAPKNEDFGPSSALTSNQEFSSVGAAFDGSSSIFSAFQDAITISDTKTSLKTNPLAKLQSLGRKLIIIVQVMFALYIVLGFVAIFLPSIRVLALGTGVVDGIGSALQFIFSTVGAALMAGCGILLTYGGILAVYTPLIPYIIFTFGAIGWFMSVLEAMIAAPIISLGILMPRQGSEILGQAEPALMKLFELFLRPSLMVFGLMVAMLFAPVAVTLINMGFSGVMASITSTGPVGSPSLLESIMFVGAYVGLVVAALNKAFSLIHIIPAQVLSWIGGQGVGDNAEGALGGAKGGVDAAGGLAKSAVEGVGGAAKAARKVRDIKEEGDIAKTAATLRPGQGEDK